MDKNLLREVLIIEDNPGDVGLLKVMLQDDAPNNTVLVHVECMSDAEKYLGNQSADMILLDLGLPDAQGVEAVRRARAAAPRTPLVVLTGFEDDSLALQALQEGAQDYLVKGEMETRGLLRALRYAAERKVMQDALFVEMQRAQVTLDSIGDAVICTDNAAIITFLNLAAENLTGWSGQAAVGRPVTDILRLPDPSKLYSAANPAATTAGQSRTAPVPSDSVLIRKNGVEVAIEDCVSPIYDREGLTSGAVIVLRDVTERIKAQRDIMESKRILEDLFDNSDTAIIDCDFSSLFRALHDLKRDGVADLRSYIGESDERQHEFVDILRMNGANAAALRMFDVTSIQDIPHQDKVIIDIADSIFRGEENIKRSDFMVTNRAAVSVLYSLRLPKTEEDARRVPIVIMDLTNVRLAEAARQATIAKSLFLSSMSHEIRTPLNGVIGNLELIALTSLDDEQFELIDDAGKAAKALMALVGNILDFSKIEADKLITEMSDINPAALMEEAVDILQSRARQKKIFITSTVSPDVPTLVRGDSMRLRQILLNLIGNAVKYTDLGGVQVTLTTTAAAEDGCELRFDISDSGRGFDQSHGARLFEPFIQAPNSADGTEGTGLGLSICKSLVEIFGGTIDCKAVPGEGATFWFTLPAQIVSPAPPIARPDLSGVRAMVIGQEGRVTQWLGGYFEARGAAVTNQTCQAALPQGPLWGSDDTSLIDIAVFVPDGGNLEGATLAQWLRQQHVVSLLYGCDQPARSRLRQGFRAMIPIDASSDHLDRNILLLLGHAKARDRLALQQSAAVAAMAGALRGTHVLVLEDRLINQTVIRNQLTKLGVDCTLVVNGLKGLEMLERRSFDLVLCDCSMPGMDGYEFTRALREREASRGDGRRLTVIALTANAFREDAENCYAAGMDDFISKPVTMDRLSAALVKWMKASEMPAGRKTGAAIAPPIDLLVLAEIMGSDDPDILTIMLVEFRAVVGVSLAEVEAAVSSGACERVRAAAHGAKGEARSAAANRLAALYGDIERVARDGDQSALQGLVGQAAAEVRRVLDFIRERLGTASL